MTGEQGAPDHDAVTAAGQAPSAAVAPLGGDAETTRAAARAARADLTRAVRDVDAQVKSAKAELEAQRRSLEAEFAAKRAELEAKVAPLRAELERMSEVLWSCDLYLGRGEDLVLLRDGSPAPAGTPITVRQKVLSMAEESLVALGRKVTGMDADDVPDFVRWLTEDDAHLARVLPEPKGVVVLVPTRVESRSENVWEAASKDAANSTSYWVIRNGQQVYLLTVDPELQVTQRVLPNRREFTDIFERRLFGFARTQGPVEPGSAEWQQMQAAADARRRHYMRVMLVLQGLVDRTPVWHPLPAAGVNFLDVRAQDDGRVVLIQDDDPDALLTDGREDFPTWQKRLNARLRPGMRVVAAFDTEAFADLATDYNGRRTHKHPRLSPSGASHPDPDTPHLIEDRRDGYLVIRYQRTDKVWRRNVPVPDKPGYVYRGEHPVTPTQRASCTLHPDDRFLLPLDLASVDDLTYYLGSRHNRSKHFLSMVPTIRAALAAKKADAQTEAPFRALLADMLTQAGAPDGAALVDALIHQWKVAHAWFRPLNGDPEHEAKAAREIIAAWRAQTAALTDPDREHIITAGKGLDRAVAVAQHKDGRWLALTASPDPHEPSVFLDITPIHRDGTLGSARTWQTLSPRAHSSLTVAWSSPEWSHWTVTTTGHHYLSEPERARLVAEITAAGSGRTIAVTEHHDPTQPGTRHLFRWDWTGEQGPTDTPPVPRHDPHSRHYHDESPITVTAYQVHKARGKDATVTECSLPPGLPRGFSHYSAAPEARGLPWWPDTATRYSDARPRLVTVDDALLGEVHDHSDRCRAAWQEGRDRVSARNREAYRWVEPIVRALREQQIEQAREEFVQDFGSGADDLWDTHLATLNLTSPIHPNTLWGLVSIALQHQHPVTGSTLGDLVEHAAAHGNKAPGEWHPTVRGGRVDVGGLDTFVVPDPDPADAPTPSAPHNL